MNDAIWTYSDGGPPEGVVRYKKDQITFDSGVMKIQAKAEFTASTLSYAENAGAGQHYGDIADKTVASGELRTKFNMFRYGRYEVRMKAPHPNAAMSNGNFIASMCIFRSPKFQDWREIDVHLTGESPASVWTNVLYGNNREGWSGDIQDMTSTYPYGTGASALPAIDSRTGFHTYAFEWTPTQIRWYVDDVMIRVKDDGVGYNSLKVPDKSAKILMNLWIFNGNGFGGNPGTNEYPFAAEYDWFRFYKLDTETSYPCTPTPSCLMQSDLDESKNNPEDGL